MRDINPKQLHELEETARDIGRLIGGALKRTAHERGYEKHGFALMLFSFEGPELTWISNADRDDMVKVMEEMVARLKAGCADELSRPRGSG